MHPVNTLGRDPTLHLPASGIPGIPCFVTAELQYQPLPAQTALPLCLCLLSSSIKDTTPIGFRVHSTPVWPRINLITTAKTLFSNKVTFIGMVGQGLGLQHGFSEETIQHTIPLARCSLKHQIPVLLGLKSNNGLI